MKTPRIIVESITEITLAVILFSVAGFSFWYTYNISPTPEKQVNVLGLNTSINSWDFLTASTFQQNNLLATEENFTADYIYYLNSSEEATFQLFSLNNPKLNTQKYRVQLTIDEQSKDYVKLSAVIDGKDFPIYNALDEVAKYSDIEIAIPQNGSVVPAFKLQPLSEGMVEVKFKIAVLKIN